MYNGARVLNAQPHGEGSATFVNGDKYTGQWVNGLMHGKGNEIKFDGEVFNGQFENGFKHGPGRLTDGRTNGQQISTLRTPRLSSLAPLLQWAGSYGFLKSELLVERF